MMHCLEVPDNFGIFKTCAYSLLFMHVGDISVLSDSLTDCYAKFSSDAISVILPVPAFNINYQMKPFSMGGAGQWLAGHYITS